MIGRLHSYLTVETTTVSDSGSTAVVLVVTGLLVLAGLGMSALAYWYWKSTIPDPESLGPLHSMSARSFAALDEVEQRKALDALRPSLASTVSAESPAADVVEAASSRHGSVADESSFGGSVVDEPPFGESAVDAPAFVETVIDEPRPVSKATWSLDDDDDEAWPGDDWSDLDALQSRRPEPQPDVIEDEPRSRITDDSRSRRSHETSSAPIDPLIG